jgi:hypothetical protein
MNRCLDIRSGLDNAAHAGALALLAIYVLVFLMAAL